MSFFQHDFPSPIRMTGIAVVAAFLFVGCSNDEEPLPEEPVEAQEVVTIGGVLSSPGLISGVDPQQVSGAEVELGEALAETFSESSVGVDTRWRALSPTTVQEAVSDGDVDAVIGQLNTHAVSDEIGWVGPYATVEPALLVRREVTTEELVEPIPAGLPSVVTLDDLQQASVCVVSGSLADGAEVPAASVTVQQSATECETGMRSGRFDAVAADDLQLAGLLLDPAVSSVYDLVYWSELEQAPTVGGEPGQDTESDDADAEDFVLDERLLTVDQYWVGVAVEHCAPVAEVLSRLLSEGTLEAAFAGFEQVPNLQLRLPQPLDVTTQHCGL